MRWRTVVLACVVAGCASAPGAGVLVRPAGDGPRAEAYSHYLAACIYQRAGQLEQAAEELREAVRSAPEEIYLRIELARTYMRLHSFDDARIVCEETLAQDPENPIIWTVLGWLYQQLERYDDAVRAFHRAVDLRPDNAFGYEALVQAAEAGNDLVTALEIYERLVELKPESALLQYQLGYACARINDLEGARKAMERALELAPDYDSARSSLGLVYLDLNLNEEAIEQFTAYLKSDAADPAIYEHLAGAYARVGDYEKSLESLDALASSEGTTSLLNLERVYVLLRDGRFHEAVEMAPPEQYPILGATLWALARKHAGIPYLGALESLDEIDGDVDQECREALVELIYLFGKPDAAGFFISALGGLEADGVRSRRLLMMIARSYMILDEYREAAAVLQQALDQFGPDKWTHYNLASAYEHLNQPEEIEQHLRACLELDPLDPEVMNFLGYFYAEQGVSLSEARKLLTKALEIDPDNGFYLDSLGWICYQKGEAEQAVELIRRAILKMDTDDAVLRDHLGDAYLLRGEPEKAIAEWRRAVRLDPELEGVREKIQLYKKEEPPAASSE